MAIAKALMTAEELLKLPDDGRRYELLDGELVEMAPAGWEHGRVAARAAHRLLGHVEAQQLGEVVSGDPGIILRRNPDRVRAPDVCFVARDRLPREGVLKGYVDIVPDLVVEVISPNDTAAEVQQKIEEWLSAGARLVWAMYPDTRSVVAYRGLADVRVYTESDTLDAAPVLPDFTCPVASLFS